MGQIRFDSLEWDDIWDSGGGGVIHNGCPHGGGGVLPNADKSGQGGSIFTVFFSDVLYGRPFSSDVNKDWTGKDKDEDKD